MYLGFKSNAIQVGRLFLLHTPSTLLVIRIVYEDYVWMLKAKKRGGIKPPHLTLHDVLLRDHITPLSQLLR